MRGRSSGTIPGPVSRTSNLDACFTVIAAAARAARIDSHPPPGMKRNAFSARLKQYLLQTVPVRRNDDAVRPVDDLPFPPAPAGQRQQEIVRPVEQLAHVAGRETRVPRVLLQVQHVVDGGDSVRRPACTCSIQRRLSLPDFASASNPAKTVPGCPAGCGSHAPAAPTSPPAPAAAADAPRSLFPSFFASA